MESYEKLISQALTAHQSGQIDIAEKHYQELLNSGYRSPLVTSNLAIILKQKGKKKQAIRLFKEAIKLDPLYGAAYNNLGNLLLDLNHLEEAEMLIRTSICLEPNSWHTNKTFSRLLALQENNAHLLKQSIICMRMFPNSAFAYKFAAHALVSVKPGKFEAYELKSICHLIFSRKDIDHKKLFKLINFFVPQNYIHEIATSTKNIFNSEILSSIVSNDLVIEALRLFVFSRLDWEKALTNARRDICLKIAYEDCKITNSLFEFIISLATQCFLNEYIYFYDEDEFKALELIISRCTESQDKEALVSIASCYLPINKLVEKIPSLKEIKSPFKSYNKLLLMHFSEKESDKEIPKYTFINDISQLVKKHYEESPYPRWQYIDLAFSTIPIIEQINADIGPNKIKGTHCSKVNNVLIAGCGTGQQAVIASRYKDVEITAIDLSIASLKYAKRKANELGINNINFIQMDILEIALLNKKFDVIECCGVLHHMQTPQRGLKSLLEVLQDDGYLKLGLYSNLARKEITKVQEQIAMEQIKPSQKNIIDFRHKLISDYYPNLNIAKIVKFTDFFTTSMFKDLFFHPKEHQFNINQLKNMLEKHELEFLGFILPQEIKSNYQQMFTQDLSQLNLNSWKAFEEQCPSTFSGMYNFWCRKKK